MKYDLVIKNGKIVTSAESYYADLAIRDGLIAAVGTSLEGNREINAEGKLVTPGAVDTHLHLEMPIGDYVSTDDFYTGTVAAAFGGTTSIIDFVETEEHETMTDGLEKRKSAAAERSVIDYGLHMTVSPHDRNLEVQIPKAYDAGCQSFKLYMAYGLRLTDGELYNSLKCIGETGGLAVVHAENWDLITSLIQDNLANGRTSPHWHPRSRPEIFEAEAAERIITIADFAKVPLHIFHVSCPAAAKVISQARFRGKRVTAETCPQYLFLNHDLYDREGVLGALPVCSPPLRSEESRKGMWNLLSQGFFQTISTDHCPFTVDEKKQGMGAYNSIPGGVPSIEMRFASLFSGGVSAGIITENHWVDMCCTAPAALYGMKNKGRLLPGYDADIVIFDPEKEKILSAETLHEAADWTPYDGLSVKGWPLYTLSRGEIIIQEEEFTGTRGRGRFLIRK